MDKAKSSFNIEKGVWRCWNGGAEILCLSSGAIKNRWGQGEGVKSGYRTKGVITWLELRDWFTCRDPGTLVKRNKNQLCHYKTTEPAQYCDARIPAGIFPSNHACHAARWMNHTRNMHTAFNLYIKLAALGWPFSCNTGIKVTSAKLSSPAHVFRPRVWVAS